MDAFKHFDDRQVCKLDNLIVAKFLTHDNTTQIYPHDWQLMVLYKPRISRTRRTNNGYNLEIGK